MKEDSIDDREEAQDTLMSSLNIMRNSIIEMLYSRLLCVFLYFEVLLQMHRNLQSTRTNETSPDVP